MLPLTGIPVQPVVIEAVLVSVGFAARTGENKNKRIRSRRTDSSLLLPAVFAMDLSSAFVDFADFKLGR